MADEEVAQDAPVELVPSSVDTSINLSAQPDEIDEDGFSTDTALQEFLDQDEGVEDSEQGRPESPSLVEQAQETAEDSVETGQTTPPQAEATQPSDLPEQSQPVAETPRTAEQVLSSLGLLPTGLGQAQEQVSQPLPAAAAPAPEPTPETGAYQTAIDHLAEHRFSLDPTVAEDFAAEGNDSIAKWAPQFASRVYLDAVQTSLAQVAQMLPTMLAQYAQQQTEQQRYDEAFYSFWNERGYDLRQHEPDIVSLGRAYLQANPSTSVAAAIQQVGAQLIVSKQLAPAGQQPVQAAPDPRTVSFQSASTSPGALAPQTQLSGFAALDDELFGVEEEY